MKVLIKELKEIKEQTVSAIIHQDGGQAGIAMNRLSAAIADLERKELEKDS